MSAFLYGIGLQWKMNMRDKEMLIFYYIVPLVFYLMIGGVFTSIMPDIHKTLIQAMVVFGVTMGGVLGSPYPLVEVFGGEIKKSYQVGNIPLWTIVLGNYISAFLHLLIMSMVIFFTAPIIFDAVVPQNLSSYFIGLIVLILASLSVGTVFGLFIKSSAKIGMATQLVFLPSIMLSGIMFPASMLPEVLQYVGKIMPATWGFETMCQNKIAMPLLLPMGVMIVLLFGAAIFKLRKISVE